MPTLRQKQRCQRTLLYTGLGLACYFLAVSLPLSQHVGSLDEPLQTAWDRVTRAGLTTDAITDPALSVVKDRLHRTEQMLRALQDSGRQALARVELEADVRVKTAQPFQLVDYQNERQRRVDELTRAAKQNQVTLDAAALGGLPEFTADRSQPELLWAQLALANHVLASAIACKVGLVRGLTLAALQPHFVEGETNAFLHEMPVDLQVTGAMESVAKFLASLPLRDGELKTSALPEPGGVKPALFLSKLLLRRTAPEKTDEVQAELRLSGFLRTP